MFKTNVWVTESKHFTKGKKTNRFLPRCLSKVFNSSSIRSTGSFSNVVVKAIELRTDLVYCVRIMMSL